MYEIKKSYSYTTGLYLCPLSGKNQTYQYTLTLAIRGEKLLSEGYLISSEEIDEQVAPMLSRYFEGKELKKSLELQNLTVESVAKWIYDYLRGQNLPIYSIELFEKGMGTITYWEI